jgi:hypothetical protein
MSYEPRLKLGDQGVLELCLDYFGETPTGERATAVPQMGEPDGPAGEPRSLPKRTSPPVGELGDGFGEAGSGDSGPASGEPASDEAPGLDTDGETVDAGDPEGHENPLIKLNSQTRLQVVAKQKYIICTVLPGGNASINAWSSGALERNFDRMHLQYPAFLPVAAFKTQVTLFKNLTGIKAVPVTVPIARAARIFCRVPVAAGARFEVLQQMKQLDTDVAADLYMQWSAAVAAATDEMQTAA